MPLPPGYAPSCPSPTYSSSPLEDEQTLEYSPRGSRNVTVPSGKLIKNCRFATIILKGQNANEELPSYGRNSFVSGEIGLMTDQPISRVSVKLIGYLALSVSDTGSSTTTIVSESKTLWAQDDLGSEKCPSVLPFMLPFPPTFHHYGRTLPLPPSFEFISYELPAVCARCSYTLRLSIKRIPSKFAFWNPSKSYIMRLNYRPRTRPQRPVTHISTLFSTLKHMPEEWLQLMSTMHKRPQAVDVQPISCHLFVPSAGTFGFTDNIPYHIQLSAPLSSLRYLFHDEKSEAAKPPNVRVYMTRQVMVEINGRQVWRGYSIGEGAVRALPPPASTGISNKSDDNVEVTLDWEGEVRCNEDVNFGTFNIVCLTAKDFIVFSLIPPFPRTCPFLPLKYAHPIKLVTDTWVDTDTSHPSDT